MDMYNRNCGYYSPGKSVVFAKFLLVNGLLHGNPCIYNDWQFIFIPILLLVFYMYCIRTSYFYASSANTTLSNFSLILDVVVAVSNISRATRTPNENFNDSVETTRFSRVRNAFFFHSSVWVKEQWTLVAWNEKKSSESRWRYANYEFHLPPSWRILPWCVTSFLQHLVLHIRLGNVVYSTNYLTTYYMRIIASRNL